jgi:YopX protein
MGYTVRTLRFRAWDGNKMLYQDKDKFVVNHDGKYQKQTESTFDIHDYPLMQFTGFTDREGTPIYEHDVVEFYYKGQDVRCAVIWSEADGMFCLQWRDGYINKYMLNPEKYKVVGNTYELRSYS